MKDMAEQELLEGDYVIASGYKWNYNRLFLHRITGFTSKFIKVDGLKYKIGNTETNCLKIPEELAHRILEMST